MRFSAAAAFANDSGATVRCTAPGGPLPEQSLPLVAPGRYLAEFTIAALGDYEFAVHGGTAESAPIARRALVLDYPDELRLGLDEPDRGAALLREVARLSGGQFEPTPEAALSATGRPANRLQPLWQYFLLAAGAALLVETACRRLAGS